MSIRAVFFDLDDTLCDTVGTREARAGRVFELLEPEMRHVNIETFVARVLEPIEGNRRVRGLRAVLEDMGMAGTPAGVEAMRLWSFVGCEELMLTFPGVRETVADLSREYEVGVITNWSNEAEQRNKLRHLRLDGYVQHLIVSGSVGCEKPDPRIFEHGLSLGGVKPGEAIYVGDRLDLDVAGAQGAGIRAVWFNHWGGTLDGSGVTPDAIIEHFSELPAAIRRLLD